jgi:hypothetical protein
MVVDQREEVVRDERLVRLLDFRALEATGVRMLVSKRRPATTMYAWPGFV